MRALLQRVSSAQVTVDQKSVGKIKTGLLIFLGIESSDSIEDIEWLCNKIVKMRLFNDENEKMNYSVLDVMGELLVVSQFTLHASTKKGNRPSYIKAATPDIAKNLYLQFTDKLSDISTLNVATGTFGAMMDVSLVNDGPVTIWLDTKNKE